MGPRILDAVMTDEDYEALRKKLLETYSVRPTLLDSTVKRLVDWHCLETSCFLDNTVFDRREKWMRHHQRFHNRMCGSDRGYPKEMDARQFIQEHARRENTRGGIAGAGGSAGLMPLIATRAGPYSQISGAARVIPPNYAAPSSSTSGAIPGAFPSSVTAHSPSSGALLNSVAARRRGPRGPYRPRENKAARREEHRDQGIGLVNIAGGLQDEPESFETLDAAKREILMQQLSHNLQAVSRINADSVRIMQILGLPSTNWESKIRPPAGGKRPRESPDTRAQGYPTTRVATPAPLPTWVDRKALASTSRGTRGLQADQSKLVGASHFNEGPAHHVFKATPYPSWAPAHLSQHSSQALALPIERPTHPYEGPPFSIEPPAHPYEAPALSIEGSAHLALTHMTRSQPDEKEEEENYNAASDSERGDSDPGSDSDYIYQAEDEDVSEDANEGQVERKNVKVEAHDV